MFPDYKIFRYRFDFAPKPLGVFIQERYFQNNSESDLEEIIDKRVLLNGEKVGPEAIIQQGDWLEYTHLRDDEKCSRYTPQVLYEDEWLVAISKPDYLPVTPSTSYYFNSMAILVKEVFNDNNLSPVHRLDIETSGVLLFGKDKLARRKIQMMFQEHQVEKCYQTITFGDPKVESISGDLVLDEDSKIFTKLILKPAVPANSLTLVSRTTPWGDFYRCWVKPITGKTNQIRAHLAAVGCAIVGDKKYYPDESVFLDWFQYRDIDRILPKVKLNRQALHCESISFTSPFTHKTVTIQDQSPEWDQKIQSLLPDTPEQPLEN